MIREKLEKAFKVKGERSAMAALMEYPEVILWSFVWTGGHTKYVLYEFPFGSKYRADFVVLLSYSGMWEITFVECENTDDKVINKNGTPSQRMNQAISQIHDWDEYIEKNKISIQSDLADWCSKKDILKMHPPEYPISNESGDLLSNSNTIVRFDYRIIMGRRKNVTKEARRKIEHLAKDSMFELCTYDRFLDIAKNLDDYRSGKYESIRLTKHDD